MIGSVEQIYESEQKQLVTREWGRREGGNSMLSRPINFKEALGKHQTVWHELACEM